MATNSKTRKPAKPTVFLSHSSANRRELLGLKRLLDERAGGLIDFFLSSDDDSIAHGTIWPAEVRAALDRMSLMLIFVSSEALKSGWTYFEAGYGLHKLGSAKIYCLPGADKGSLPSPFNILQNRNLHSVRDVSLLIKQCNEALSASMKDNVSQEEFDRIFKKPLMVQLETGPSFERLVKTITVSMTGPPNSAEIFTSVCQKRGFTASPVPSESRVLSFPRKDEYFSTGLRLSVERPYLDDFLDELEISKSVRASGKIAVRKYGDDSWRVCNDVERWYSNAEEVTVADLDDYNTRIRAKNEETRSRNEKKKLEPRDCEFELAPTNVSVPTGIVDDWIVAAKIRDAVTVRIFLHEEVQRESRVETITAKIHGSELSLRSDGSYLWAERVIVRIKWIGERRHDLELTAASEETLLLSDFRLQDLVTTLFELNLISLTSQRSGARRR
jgi:hypothetical protein